MSEDVSFYQQSGFCDNANGKIFHGFFKRSGGVSEGDYYSLNCGEGSGDDKDIVQQNRARVAAKAGVAAQDLLSVYQEHGANVAVVTQGWSERPKADAMVTDKAGLALGILTADCAPVLFCGYKDNGAPVIGAAHAGWRGAVSGILCNTVAQMIELGAQKETIKACVGPCIGKQSYEVSIDFTNPFLDEDEESERFFHAASKADHLMFDLAGYCAWRLACAGVKSVSILDKDTYSNEADFFSYRRMTHRGQADYGRQISVISISS